MTFDDINAVWIVIAFIVPGFILSSVLTMRIPRKSRSASELAYQYLTLSCVNHGLWSWLIVIMIQGDWLARAPLGAGLAVFGIIFVSPVVLGLALGGLSRTEFVGRLLSAIGFRLQRFIPTAWDYKFQEEELSWIIVRLKDGSTIRGFWGTHSFAGDDPQERDLYMEALFQPGNGGHWQPIPDTGGILIKGNEIAAIEFVQIESKEG